MADSHGGRLELSGCFLPCFHHGFHHRLWWHHPRWDFGPRGWQLSHLRESPCRPRCRWWCRWRNFVVVYAGVPLKKASWPKITASNGCSSVFRPSATVSRIGLMESRLHRHCHWCGGPPTTPPLTFPLHITGTFHNENVSQRNKDRPQCFWTNLHDSAEAKKGKQVLSKCRKKKRFLLRSGYSSFSFSCGEWGLTPEHCSASFLHPVQGSGYHRRTHVAGHHGSYCQGNTRGRFLWTEIC